MSAPLLYMYSLHNLVALLANFGPSAAAPVVKPPSNAAPMQSMHVVTAGAQDGAIL